ncbi:MAG: Phospholipase C, partial [Pleopsidium flavum]
MTSTAASSPSPAIGGSLNVSPSSPPFARLPPKQHVITSVPLTLTPASAASTSGSIPSSTTSPANASLQSSPEGLRGRNSPQTSSPGPLQLPDAAMAICVSPQSAMSEAVTLNKGPGLMRRISRGAASRLTRRRPSANHVNSRDHSSGPVIMRRRSGSRSDADIDRDMVGLELDGDDEEAVDDTSGPVGLGLIEDGAGNTSIKRAPRGDTEGGIGPIVPRLLQRGTTLTKVSKKKRKSLTFYLDVNSAKVYWNPSDPTKRFYIDDIQQIRVGSDARNYREECCVSAEAESRWFTIVYADQDRAKGRPVKTMHLIAPNDYMFGLWTSTLEDVSRY